MDAGEAVKIFPEQERMARVRRKWGDHNTNNNNFNALNRTDVY